MTLVPLAYPRAHQRLTHEFLFCQTSALTAVIACCYRCISSVPTPVTRPFLNYSACCLTNSAWSYLAYHAHHGRYTRPHLHGVLHPILMNTLTFDSPRIIDFDDRSIKYVRRENLVQLTCKDKATGKTANCLVEPHVASKHFAQKLASWKAMSRSKK